MGNFVCQKCKCGLAHDLNNGKIYCPECRTTFAVVEVEPPTPTPKPATKAFFVGLNPKISLILIQFGGRKVGY